MYASSASLNMIAAMNQERDSRLMLLMMMMMMLQVTVTTTMTMVLTKPRITLRIENNGAQCPAASLSTVVPAPASASDGAVGANSEVITWLPSVPGTFII